MVSHRLRFRRSYPMLHTNSLVRRNHQTNLPTLTPARRRRGALSDRNPASPSRLVRRVHALPHKAPKQAVNEGLVVRKSCRSPKSPQAATQRVTGYAKPLMVMRADNVVVTKMVAQKARRGAWLASPMLAPSSGG